MDLTQPKPIEERVREEYADSRIEDGTIHEEAICEAIKNTVAVGYDDEHLGRAMRELAKIDEHDFDLDAPSSGDLMDESEAAYRRDVGATEGIIGSPILP